MWKTESRQPRANSSREKSIKQNARLSVKHALPLVILALFGAPQHASAFRDDLVPPEDPAQNTPPPDAQPTDAPPADPSQAQAPDQTQAQVNDQQPLPDIEAKLRQLKVLKSSTSKRVYLLDLAPLADAAAAADSAEKPPERKILLLRHGDENIMALRVLRDIHGTNQVIAKKIKQYGDYVALDIGQEFFAIEKISDVIPPPPTPQEKVEMAEVEPEPLAYDPDLDKGTSPDPDGSDDEDPRKKEEDEDARLGASIEEKVVPFEPQRHWLTVAFGALRNTPDGDFQSARYYMGGGIRYGYDVGRRIFNTRDDRLDTFTIEGSLFYYSVSGLDSTDSSTALDTYTLTPIELTGRYTYYYNEDFGLFAYGGFMKNFVMSSQNSTADRVSNLSLPVPAIGVGALLRFGPQWYTRIDVGLDMISANLMIRF
jgi:hypothetical protein